MKLTKGKTYSARNSVLKVTILNISQVSDEYTKARVFITNGIYREINTYKLIHRQISHWREV